MDRAEFIERQTRAADARFSLTVGEETAQQRFRLLAIDTYDFLTSAGAKIGWAFTPSDEYASSVAYSGRRDDGSRVELSPELIQRWENWNREYSRIRARNPRLELRDFMQNISESHNATSWPVGYERHIQAWVDAGDPSAPPPFDDRYNIVSPEFFNRLRELRQLCGGWLYSSDNVPGLVFAPEPEWQLVRGAQEAAAAKSRKEWEESKAKSERYMHRLPEIIAIARSDKTFWDALGKWELEREAKHPSKPPPPDRLGGPLRIVRLSAEEQERSANPPVDRIFADFLARVREPGDDLLAVRDIVLLLRIEIRRDLGLADTGWSAGSGIGVA